MEKLLPWLGHMFAAAPMSQAAPAQPVLPGLESSNAGAIKPIHVRSCGADLVIGVLRRFADR
jgi:hypothetical protein